MPLCACANPERDEGEQGWRGATEGIQSQEGERGDGRVDVSVHLNASLQWAV